MRPFILTLTHAAQVSGCPFEITSDVERAFAKALYGYVRRDGRMLLRPAYDIWWQRAAFPNRSVAEPISYWCSVKYLTGLLFTNKNRSGYFLTGFFLTKKVFCERKKGWETLTQRGRHRKRPDPLIIFSGLSCTRFHIRPFLRIHNSNKENSSNLKLT